MRNRGNSRFSTSSELSAVEDRINRNSLKRKNDGERESATRSRSRSLSSFDASSRRVRAFSCVH